MDTYMGSEELSREENLKRAHELLAHLEMLVQPSFHQLTTAAEHERLLGHVLARGCCRKHAADTATGAA